MGGGHGLCACGVSEHTVAGKVSMACPSPPVPCRALERAAEQEGQSHNQEQKQAARKKLKEYAQG